MSISSVSDTEFFVCSVGECPELDERKLYSVANINNIDLDIQLFFPHLIVPRIFFETKADAETVGKQIVSMKSLVHQHNSEFPAYCDHPYCPAFLGIRSVSIGRKQYYYLFYIPHVHEPSVYKGDPSILPPFCQRVLYYYSGLHICDCLDKPDLSSPFSFLIQRITEEKRRMFSDECEGSLQECARNTLGCEIDSEIKISGSVDEQSAHLLLLWGMMKTKTQPVSSISNCLLPLFRSSKEFISEKYLSGLCDSTSAIINDYYDNQSHVINNHPAMEDLDMISMQLSCQLQWIDLIRPILQRISDNVETMKNGWENSRDSKHVRTEWNAIQSNIYRCCSLFKTKNEKDDDNDMDKKEEDGYDNGYVLPTYIDLSRNTIQCIKKEILQLSTENEEEMNRPLSIQLITQRLLDCSSVKSTVFLDISNVNIVGGLFEINNYYIQFCRDDNINKASHFQLIIANKPSDKKRVMKMAVLIADTFESELIEVDSSIGRENEVIDLNRKGRRWEGGELNGKPFGFGCEYSEDDNLVYEGFVFEGKKVCFGKEWNDNGNNNCLIYEGGFCNSMHFGRGISHNLHGEKVYEGEWKDDIALQVNHDWRNELVVPITIEEIIIGNDVFTSTQYTSLFFSPLFCRLKRVEIGNNCFRYVRIFVINGLPKLETITVGEKCFHIGDEERRNGLGIVENCPKLQYISTGFYSFKDFRKLKLSKLDSLKTLDFGVNSFMFSNCKLKDFPKLERITFRDRSFANCRKALFENLPALKDISFIGGRYALAGDDRLNKVTMINGHESYDNSLILRNLPELVSIHCEGDCTGIHKFMGNVTLDDIPQLRSENIHFGDNSFGYTTNLQVRNASDLGNIIDSFPKEWEINEQVVRQIERIQSSGSTY